MKLSFVLLSLFVTKAAFAAGSYSIESLREMSLSRNFDNRIEYEKVSEARKASQAAYLALAPRLTINSAVTILSGDGVGLMAAAGDLVPFLFPTNWLQAQGSELQAQAERITHRIMRLNTAVQVESLANLILRDQAIAGYTESLIAEVGALRDEVFVRESLGQYPAGSTANLDAILYNLKSDLMTLKSNEVDQYVQLSVMAGFRNPSAIRQTFWKNEKNDIDHPWTTSEKALLARALDLSLEIKQSNKLIELAQTNVTKSFWSWLDPSGNYLTGLGLFWGKNIEIARAQLREASLQREKLSVTTQRDVKHAYIMYLDALSHYRLAREALKTQEIRKKTMMDRIHMGAKIDFFGLIQIFQDHLQTRAQIENSIAQYRGMRAQLRRLSLQEEK